MMMDCDTLLMVGSSFPYSEFLPKEGQARGVQIDIDPAMLSHPLPDGGQPRRRREATLRALIPLLAAQDRSRLARDDREERRRVVAACSRRAR